MIDGRRVTILTKPKAEKIERVPIDSLLHIHDTIVLHGSNFGEDTSQQCLC